jgi:hypothetical protein
MLLKKMNAGDVVLPGFASHDCGNFIFTTVVIQSLQRVVS